MTYDQIVGLLDDPENAVRPGPGKYERCEDLRIAQALHELSGDTSNFAEWGDAGESFFQARIGRFVIEEDEQGFFEYAAFDSNEAASNYLVGGEAENAATVGW